MALPLQKKKRGRPKRSDTPPPQQLQESVTKRIRTGPSNPSCIDPDVSEEKLSETSDPSNVDFWFDARYQHAIARDFDDLSEKEQHQYAMAGICSIDELYRKIQKYRQTWNGLDITLKKYDASISQYIKFDMQDDTEIESDHFVLVQLALALRKNIPILYISSRHQRLFWNGNTFRCRDAKTNYYVCMEDDCKFTCSINKSNQLCYSAQKAEAHSHVNDNGRDVSDIHNIDLINDIITDQILCAAKKINDDDELHLLYDRIVTRYRYRLPFLTMDYFIPYHELEKRMRTRAPPRHLCHAVDVKSFVENTMPRCLRECIKSATNREHYIQNELLYSVSEDGNFILSDQSLMRILADADFWSGDGTFAIRPVFTASITGERYKRRVVLHDQVFKLFAVRIHRTKDNEIHVEKSYMIAIGLLKGRKETAYTWFFERILDYAQKMQLVIPNVNFVSDYEKALRNAAETLKAVHMQVLGDTFHFTYNVLKKVKNLGLGSMYSRKRKNKKYDKKFRALIECVYALQYIKPEKVRQFGKIICKLLQTHFMHKYKPVDHAKIADFIWYIAYTYLEYDKAAILTQIIEHDTLRVHLADRKPNGCRYGITEWNVYMHEITSNNSAEVHNQHDKRKLGIRPVMVRLFKWFFAQASETKRRFYANEKNPLRPKSDIHHQSRKKQQLLCKYWKSTMDMDWELFTQFSYELSLIRLHHKGASPFVGKVADDSDMVVDMLDLLQSPDMENEVLPEDINENVADIPTILQQMYINHMADAPCVVGMNIEENASNVYCQKVGNDTDCLMLASLEKRYSTRSIQKPKNRCNRFR